MNFRAARRQAKVFLYRGHSDDIFWFSLNDNGDLKLHVLDDRNDGTATAATKVYSIKKGVELYRHVTEGNYVEKGSSSFENPVPTLIANKAGRRFCVFTFSDQENPFPAVYIYDVQRRKNLAKASGASIFLHYEPDPVSKKDEGTLYFYCNVLTASNVHHPRAHINNKQGGLFKLLEKQMRAVKSSAPPLDTWYECKVNFGALVASKECIELVQRLDVPSFKNIAMAQNRQQAPRRSALPIVDLSLGKADSITHHRADTLDEEEPEHSFRLVEGDVP